MPKFGEVFSTTAKVIGALCVISLIAGVIYAVVGVAGSVANSAPPPIDTHIPDSLSFSTADAIHTKVTETSWNKIIHEAIKIHCPLEGMTEDQVKGAVGQPESAEPNPDPAAGGSVIWKYKKDVEKECIRYDGDKCAERNIEHQTATYYFSKNGRLSYPYDDDIYRLSCFSEPFYNRYYQQIK